MPTHIQDTVRAIAQIHVDHHQRHTPLQRFVDRTTALFGKPSCVVILAVIILAWVLINLGLAWSGWKPLDAPPFEWLQLLTSVVALFATVLILTTQRREDQLADDREQLTLELAILAEQKSTKIINLLEEMRRDSPHLVDRVDEEAATMSTRVDPQSLIDTIRDTHEELAQSDKPNNTQLFGDNAGG